MNLGSKTMSASYGTIEQSAADVQKKTAVGSCSQIEAASNLIAVLTGAGMLSLPYTAGVMGWSALGLLLLVTLGFLYSFVLLAESVDTVMIIQHNRAENPLSQSTSNQGVLVDYIVLGKEAFGNGGDKVVFTILGTELFLALVSFLINIGLNVHIVVEGISVEAAIFIAACIALYLSLYDMKVISSFTIGGNIATGLTVFALVLSGFFLIGGKQTANYSILNVQGVPMSLGIMAYCFGGHGAL